MMETVRKAIRYLAGLEWTEKRQRRCLFCDREGLRSVVYEVGKDGFFFSFCGPPRNQTGAGSF